MNLREASQFHTIKELYAGGPGSGRRPGGGQGKQKTGGSQHIQQRHLGRLEKLAKSYEKEGNSYLVGPEKDKGMASMHHGDARDIRKIIEHLKNGNYYKAAAKADNLDTDVRDDVYSRVGSKLGKAAKEDNPRGYSNLTWF